VFGEGLPTPRLERRIKRPTSNCYLERAMLLWPRLDRAKLRRIANDPIRIAEMVERRTSLPFDSILAMLTRQNPSLSQTESTAGFESSHADSTRVELRIVRSDGGEIRIQDLPA
jgi:hypothetical protein